VTEQIPETSTPTQRRLAQQLRELRQAAGLTGAQLAARCGWTQSKVSKIENCRTVPQVDDVEAWARQTESPDIMRTDLVDLAGRALTSVTAWRTELRYGRTSKQEEIRDIEASVSTIRAYQPLIVPGLLQTAEYVRRVFMLGRKIGPDDIPAAVRARMQRQEILYEQGKHLEFLIAEPGLRWRVGPLHVLVGQLDRINSLIDLPQLRIGVIPWSHEATVLHYTGFQIFGEPGQDEPVLVSAETLTENLRIHAQDKVDLYLAKFDQLREAALFGSEARVLIASISTELQQQHSR
jgi:transcriptional regulator with XRE-family HTH domain